MTFTHWHHRLSYSGTCSNMTLSGEALAPKKGDPMKSMDVFSERMMRESGFDARTSRTLSREATDLDKESQLLPPELQPTLNSQDKLAMTAAAFMAGSPLMFLGLGATFFFCDEMDHQRKEEYLRNMSFNDHQQFAFNAIAFRAALAERNKLRQSTIPVELTAADKITDVKLGKPAKRDGKVISLDTRRGKRPYFAPNKSWQEAKRLIKRKEYIADQIKRFSQMQNYSLVCKLASEVELLDKAIRRLGY